MSDSLRPHGLQLARLPCTSLAPRVCSNLCPLSQWCYLTISSSTAPLSFCLQSSPASGSFPMSWLTRWPKYWSFSFSTSPSSEYSVLISFRIDLFDLLAVQGTLKSHLQHHSLRTSILWCSAFFIVHLSHPYVVNCKVVSGFRCPAKKLKLTFNVKNLRIKQKTKKSMSQIEKFLCKQPLKWNQIKNWKMTKKCWY